MTVTSYTDIKIVNAALVKAGSSAVNSISDPTTDKEAKCAELYTPAIADLLSAHEWSFNYVERTLAVNADKTPVQGYDYAYRLPSALLAGPYAVYGDGSSYPVFDYINSEDYIHCDYQSLKIMCRIIPPVANMPLYFISLAVSDLAMQFAESVLKKTERAAELRIETYGAAQLGGNGGRFASAKLADSKTKPARSLFANGDPLSNTRY